MQNNELQTLEQALAKTQADAAATLSAANAVAGALRKFHTAAKVGNLRDLHSSIEAAEKTMAILRQQFANAKEGWNFDEDRYFATGLYAKEVVSTGQQKGVRIFEGDERLYCYPVLIQVTPKDKAVLVDKKLERKVRPSVLVARLKELQDKPPRLKLEPFLEVLFKAYTKTVASRGKDMLQIAQVVPLLDIYELLTLLPGRTGEYSKQEFVRDIYLLHRNGVDKVKSGARVSFPASTGTRTLRGTINIITESGEEKRYYGISFTQAPRER